MLIIWKKCDFFVKIDHMEMGLQNNKIDVNLTEGWHHFELYNVLPSKTKLIKKICMNWVEMLVTATPMYTIKQSIDEVFQCIISFDIFIDEQLNSSSINVLLLPQNRVKNYIISKKINLCLFNILKCIYYIPLVLLMTATSATFIALGLVSSRNNGMWISVFSIVLGFLFLVLILIFIVKLNKDFNKFKN